MCIIAYSQKGKFNADELYQCEASNPDGIGVMVSLPEKVRIKKGFKDTKEVLAFLKKYIGRPTAIHYRIATHGAVSAQNCHPFGIGAKWADMVDGEVPAALMHNGIISLTSSNADISDSYLFARDYLPRFRKLDEIDKAMISEMTYGSRLLIFKENGRISSTGKWVKSGDTYYSNTSYEKSKYLVSSRYSGTFDDDEYMDYYYGTYKTGAKGGSYNSTKYPVKRYLGKDEVQYVYSETTDEWEEYTKTGKYLYIGELDTIYEYCSTGGYIPSKWTHAYDEGLMLISYKKREAKEKATK